jgi:hypothetical protein
MGDVAESADVDAGVIVNWASAGRPVRAGGGVSTGMMCDDIDDEPERP